MIRRYTYEHGMPADRLVEIDIPSRHIPTDVERTAGRVIIKSLLPDIERFGGPFMALGTRTDIRFYRGPLELQLQSDVPVPGKTLVLEEPPRKPYLAIARSFIGEAALRPSYDPASYIHGDISFIESEDLTPSQDCDELELSYILSSSGDIRLFGTAKGVQPGTRTHTLLDRLALTSLTSYNANIGIDFLDEPLGTEQLRGLASYLHVYGPPEAD